MIPKRYLGDSVYAEIERGMIKLTTSDGYIDSNIIYLDLHAGVDIAVSNYIKEYHQAIRSLATKASEDI